MMNDNDSNMAMNAISNAVLMVQYSFQQLADSYMAPHIMYKPKLYQDGDQWCALLGDDLQVGVAGFGNSPREAMYAFDKEFGKPIAAQKGKA